MQGRVSSVGHRGAVVPLDFCTQDHRCSGTSKLLYHKTADVYNVCNIRIGARRKAIIIFLRVLIVIVGTQSVRIGGENCY